MMVDNQEFTLVLGVKSMDPYLQVLINALIDLIDIEHLKLIPEDLEKILGEMKSKEFSSCLDEP